ncbi:MAG TPA: lipid-binding SYLF domain-containing protein [Blastocatellia bacterium]|nr:lipid-binding SYLF domain-containing protein [Blastocatellia bacterium]
MRKHLALQRMIIALSIVLVLTPALAQTRFSHAVERSQQAGRIIASLAQVPETGFPQELIGKAEAVAVFPRVTQVGALVGKATQGYGVVCSRTENGWTVPAFYQFAGAGFGNPFTPGDKFSTILLFMSKDAVARFEKGGLQLESETKALAGPVGAITDGQRRELEGAQILAYSYFNGNLKGATFERSFWKRFVLDPDNNINTPLYGMKGREVLGGKKVDRASLPAGIAAYQEALQKYYAAK